jgi:hypothetical protein
MRRTAPLAIASRVWVHLEFTTYGGVWNTRWNTHLRALCSTAASGPRFATLPLTTRKTSLITRTSPINLIDVVSLTYPLFRSMINNPRIVALARCADGDIRAKSRQGHFSSPICFHDHWRLNTATSVRWDQRAEEQLKTYASDGPSILSGALLLQFHDDVSDKRRPSASCTIYAGR